MNIVVIDVETTGLTSGRDEIIEIGAVRVMDGVITETFQTLVKPRSALPPEVCKLTGITEEMLATAPELEDCLPLFLSFIEGSVLCGHNVQFDMQFLTTACDNAGYELPVSRDVLDTADLARIVMPTAKEYHLAAVAAALGVENDVWHRALPDAQATAQLLKPLADRARQLPFGTLQELSRMASLYSQTTALWFAEQADLRLHEAGTELPPETESIHQLVFSTASLTEAEQSRPIDPEALADASLEADRLLADGSPIRDVLPGFEVRDGQLQMVRAVTDAFVNDTHLLVEAGTGTGKSLAYLIPAVLYARANDTRVVVSTHTIALQDQIEKRDFPTLRRLLGDDIRLSVLKGRTHYVCMRKLQHETAGLTFATPTSEIVQYMALVTWLVQTRDGMREELSLKGAGTAVWSRIQSETESCIHKRCPFFKACFYFRARSRAYESDVIVTNHSLIFSDLKADHHVLPAYDKLVLDEAHHLVDQATQHLGSEVRQPHCLALVGRLSRDKGKHGLVSELLRRISEETRFERQREKLSRLDETLDELYHRLDHTFKLLTALLPAGQAELRITSQTRSQPGWRDCLTTLYELDEPMQALHQSRAFLGNWAESETDDDLAGRLVDASGFLAELCGQLQLLMSLIDDDVNFVVWLDRAGSGRQAQINVHRAPIDVAEILDRMLFGKKSSVVMTSATLSVDGSFDYAERRLGLVPSRQDGRLLELSVPSPFDYGRQALLCVPNDVPELAKVSVDVAASWLADSIYQLAKESRGRLLALFTSHALLRQTANVVRDPLATAGLRLYAQGLDGNRTHLLQAFKAESKSVLFGAQSFWEGIDLPGNELTTLVIVRLPFTPPTHPVTEARHERIAATGQNPFMADSLPEAVVRFRQGFGRLIRTVSDRGVVVVYDKRLITSRYGQTFIKSLPGVTPFVAGEQAVLDRVRQFLRQAGDDVNSNIV